MNDNIYDEISRISAEIVEFCTENHLKIATAESCTGGMISAALTSVSGSSAVIELGICSYSNRIKSAVLGVSDDTLNTFSEYSLKCAEEMANGAKSVSGADFAVSTTGVAGPTGDSPEHPVGEVFIAVSTPNGCFPQRFLFAGDREGVRAQACKTALFQTLFTLKKDIQIFKGGK